MLDGTELSASINEPKGKLLSEAYGAAVSVAEIGEQLAWLGAAVRALPQATDNITCCVPGIIKDLGLDDIMQYHSIFRPSLESISIKINFEMELKSSHGAI